MKRPRRLAAKHVVRAPPDSARLLLPRAAWGRFRPRVPHPRWVGWGRGGSTWGQEALGARVLLVPCPTEKPYSLALPNLRSSYSVQNCVHTSPLSSFQVSRPAGRLCAPRARTTNTRLAPCLSLPSLTSAPATQRAHLGGRAVPTHPRKVPQHRTLLKTQTQLPRKTCFTRDSRRLQLLVAEISHPLCLSLYLPQPPPPLPLSMNSPDTLSSPSSSSSSAGRFHALPPSLPWCHFLPTRPLPSPLLPSLPSPSRRL